jgi:hypothetical protein
MYAEDSTDHSSDEESEDEREPGSAGGWAEQPVQYEDYGGLKVHQIWGWRKRAVPTAVASEKESALNEFKPTGPHVGGKCRRHLFDEFLDGTVVGHLPASGDEVGGRAGRRCSKQASRSFRKSGICSCVTVWLSENACGP